MEEGMGIGDKENFQYLPTLGRLGSNVQMGT